MSPHHAQGLYVIRLDCVIFAAAGSKRQELFPERRDAQEENNCDFGASQVLSEPNPPPVIRHEFC